MISLAKSQLRLVGLAESYVPILSCSVHRGKERTMENGWSRYLCPLICGTRLGQADLGPAADSGSLRAGGLWLRQALLNDQRCLRHNIQ